MHVLGEDLPCPSLLPYYPEAFFKTILLAKDSWLDVIMMSTKQWYNFLLEQGLTTQKQPDQPRQLVACKAELASPTTDWPEVWRRVRLPHLASETKSLIWRMMHDLLLTEFRLSRVNTKNSASCRYFPDVTSSNLEHSIFFCCKTSNMGSWLLSIVRIVVPSHHPLASSGWRWGAMPWCG